jgi:hypothetical protein
MKERQELKENLEKEQGENEKVPNQEVLLPNGSNPVRVSG